MPTVSNTDAVDTLPRQVRNADATSRRRLGTAQNGATPSSRKSAPACRETWRSGRPPTAIDFLRVFALLLPSSRNDLQTVPMYSATMDKAASAAAFSGQCAHEMSALPPIPTKLMRRNELPLCAISGHNAVQQISTGLSSILNLVSCRRFQAGAP